MPWYFPWSDSIKKRACRYLLQHYLGKFLKEKLTLDQLSVDIYNGKGTIHDVELDVGALNDTLNNFQVPIEIIDGFIGSISVSIPWSSLINENTSVEVHGLELTIQPKQRADNMTPGAMFESMMSSMTTSMDSLHVAEDILKQEPSSGQQQNSESYEGLHEFAGTIDTVLTKIMVVLKDTVVRLEHLPKETNLGVALEVRVKRIDYFDESADEPTSNVTDGGKTMYEPAAVANKVFILYDLSLYSDEFSKQSREMKSSVINIQPRTSSIPSSPEMDDFKPLRGPENDQPTVTSDPVLITKFGGRQKVKFKIKQNDALPGPKVTFDCEFVSFNAYLSPRQVHLLLELAKGVMTPATSENIYSHKKYASKPMRSADYERCEEDLQQQLLRGRSRTDDERQSWGEYEFDDVSDNSLYFSLGSSHMGMDMETSYSSSCSTNTAKSSTASGYTYKYGAGYSSSSSRDRPFQSTIGKRKYSKSKDNMQKVIDDTTAEHVQGRLRIGFFSVTILHEDPVTTPSDGIDREISSTKKLKKMSDIFFGSLPGLNSSGLKTADDLVRLREEIASFCQQESHLGLLGKPLVLDFNQKSSNSHDSFTLDLTVGILEVVECLFDKRNTTSSVLGFTLPISNKLPTYSPLLTFISEVPDTKASMYASMYSNTGTSSPCLKIALRSVEKIKHSSGRDARQGVETKIDVNLRDCQCEVDVSLVDRINALLYSQPFSSKPSTGPYQTHIDPATNLLSEQGYFNQALDEVSDQRTSISVSSPMAVVNIRFPVPDLRSGKDRRPWWVKDLRQEVLVLEISELNFKTDFHSGDQTGVYEFICKQIHGLFQLHPNQEPVSFAMVTEGLPDDSLSDRDRGFDWPRLVIKTYPQRHSVLEDAEDDEPDTILPDSLNGACQFTKGEASPFSNKKVMYDNEEMVMAGDRKEMQEFQDYAQSNTKMALEFSLPCINAMFPDNNFVELFYNRLNNDLLLWESLAPSPLNTQDQFGIFRTQPADLNSAGQLLHARGLVSDRFIMCKSGIQMEDSSSESEDDVMYSIHDTRQKKKGAQKLHQVQVQQSKMCLSLNIAHGKIGARNFAKDEEGAVQEHEHGEVLLEVIDGTLFTVIGHNGDPDLSYLCIQARRNILYHGSCLPTFPCPSPVERLTLAQPRHLDITIAPTANNGDITDMLSVAIKIKCETYTSNRKDGVSKACEKKRKDFLIAVGLQGATLRHRMVPSGMSWLSQTMDILDLKDYPILGYVLPTTVTELHVHLSHSQVDYRPLHLPVRSIITFDGFSISSNIIAESSTSVLRFIIDNAALLLSNNCRTTRLNLKEDYVCVIQIGSFELCLRSSDGKDLRSPRTDLRATNNNVKIRTCSDSFNALQDLIVYFANNGDLERVTSPSSSKSSTPAPIDIIKEVKDVNQPSKEPLTQSQTDHVNTLMAEAMRESSLHDSPDPGSRPAELFFFPDESVAAPKQKADAEDHGEEASERYYSSDSSFGNDFCIIDDPGLGIIPKDGEPKIRFLDDEPLKVIDGHFKIPHGQTDLLEAPDNFPVPVSRYVLKEMSLVWYMYGGSDFSLPEGKQATDVGARGSESYSRGMKIPTKGKQTFFDWKERGGPGRAMEICMELHLFKVRLLQESYAETAEQASRQIVLINNVEIWDRMASSQINKFLYEYTSEKMPKQTHANMVVVKALHVRPDRRRQQQECSLKVSLLPLRLNVDQDSLFFLKNFFVGSHPDATPDIPKASGHAPSSSPGGLETHPVMKVGSPVEEVEEMTAQELIKFDELSESNEEVSESGDKSPEEEALSAPVFFNSFVFSPDVPIRLDYTGKRVDMEQGTLAGLIVGLAQLNCSELKLKRFHHRHGLLGTDRLVSFALNEWLQDIKRTQLPTILGGVGPMHSLVQLVQGVKDLIWLPVEQYRKDGRIIRGLQRGANSFTTSTAMATLELTNRLVQTVQFAAEFTYDMVSPGPSIKQKAKRQKHRRSVQPADFREGVTNAYYVVKEGLSDTANNIIRAATEERDHKGISGAVGGVVRQIPPTLIQPVILASEATSNVLGGMRNQLQPEARKEDERKWKVEDKK